jgi:hypothetical protein
MTGAYADVSAVKHRLITEMLRRVASVRPVVAMVMAEALVVADERELSGLARLLESEDAELTFRLLGDVLEEAGGRA